MLCKNYNLIYFRANDTQNHFTASSKEREKWGFEKIEQKTEIRTDFTWLHVDLKEVKCKGFDFRASTILRFYMLGKT